MLLHWAIRTVDPTCLRHLQTTVDEDTINVIQQLLDDAVCVETYHLCFRSNFSHTESPNLENMQGLRTLEVSVELDWDEIEEAEEEDGEGRHNPLNNAMRSLNTASHVEHLILNLNIWNPDQLFHFMGSYEVRSTSFEDFGEDRQALRDVVVRIRSRVYAKFGKPGPLSTMYELSVVSICTAVLSSSATRTPKPSPELLPVEAVSRSRWPAPRRRRWPGACIVSGVALTLLYSIYKY
ncbi:hypothetical protein C8R44DRAFT_755021 [Mycena epipterygia]|nr:hypothetical protein C8R44DRAFT_755021 [Mycena epipterygia]